MRRLLAGLLALGVLGVVPAAPAFAQAPGCDVASATLTWGFKESFRAYIDGSIANGEWTVADGATYDTPSFGFPADSGRLDPRGPNGSIDFAGAVRFTGHGGILDTTVANPALVIRPDGSGVLLLDVSGPTMEGDQISVTEAAFLDVDLDGQDLTPVDGIVTIDAAPTTLTAEGAEAFPNYEAGAAFDPLTVTADVGDCDLTGQPIGTDAVAGDRGSDLVGLIVGGGVVALLVAISIWFARRRRSR
jgi:hypothetical protein